jgi:hypothetical protein
MDPKNIGLQDKSYTVITTKFLNDHCRIHA